VQSFRKLRRRRIAALLAAGAAACAPLAAAHTGQAEGHDFLGGLLHPLSGLDHLLAMVAVGALAWSLGRVARWLLPAGFLATATLGMAAGFAGVALPQVEPAVAASVAALGAMLLAGHRLPVAVTLAMVCVFGVLHGNAHGAEMPAVSFAARASGFLLATAVLHAAGLAAAAAITGPRSQRAHRAAQRAASPAGHAR
jgi:urease accessory protein